MQVRHAAWADQFYPGKPDRLKLVIDSYLDQAEKREFKSIIGLMAPHAGYVFSGQTAAAAYKQIQSRVYDTVVVLAPCHNSSIDGVSAYGGDFYETPLGSAPVNTDAVERLADSAMNIHISDTGHESISDRAEHSLEVQLPFLQMVLQNFNIVPLVFNDYSWENCRRLGDAIAATFDADKTLIVASTDLYHGQSYEDCQHSDAATLESVERDSPIQFCFNANNQKIMACGAGPVTALKIVAEKWRAQQPKIIAQTNSADVTGNKHGYVVGYAAAIAAENTL